MEALFEQKLPGRVLFLGEACVAMQSKLIFGFHLDSKTKIQAPNQTLVPYSTTSEVRIFRRPATLGKKLKSHSHKHSHKNT